jgi:hypothetical protein
MVDPAFAEYATHIARNQNFILLHSTLNKKLMLPRGKLERQRLKMLFFSPLMTTVEETYLKNYIYREPINTLEEPNDRIHEALAILLFLICLFIHMKGVTLEHLL